MQQYCEIATPKGMLRGFFHHPMKEHFPVLIIFHGFTGCNTGTKFSYVQLARLLEAKGIGTIRMDFLGTGESDLNFNQMTFDDELSCARVILEEVLKMPSTTEVYLLGHSMGGAIASEIAKLYPDKIAKMVLWAPAFNLPTAVEYLKGIVPEADFYDHGGFEISNDFVKDIMARDFYKDLSLYQHPLMIIHGKADTTVPFKISQTYLKGFHEGTIFHPIDNANHDFDERHQIKEVISLTYHFLSEKQA